MNLKIKKARRKTTVLFLARWLPDEDSNLEPIG
jgi:hypothetical protein